MRKVLIVDDEMLVRVGLKTMFPWNEHNFEVSGEAKNGIEALNKLENEKYDLLITDISMPIMDGLELIENIIEKQIDIKILILTHYDEFSYAKKAINLGVEDYILKSELTKEKIENVLERIFKGGSTPLPEKSSSFTANGIKILKLLLDKQIAAKDIFKNQMTKLGIDNKKASFVMIYGFVFFDDIEQYNDPSHKIQIIKHIFHDSYKFSKEAVLFYSNGNEFLAVVEIDNRTDDSLSKLENANVHFNKNLLQILNSDQLISSSDIFKEFDDAYDIFEQLQNNTVLEYFGANKLDNKLQNKNFTIDFSLLSNIILKRNIDEITKYINLAMEYISSLKSVPTAYKYLQNLNYILKDSVKTFSDNQEDVDIQQKRKRLTLVSHFDEHKDIIDFQLRTLKDSFSKNSSYSYLVSKTIDFIKENYNSEITLGEIAAMLNVSNSYLSSIFSRETGSNITSYINNLRIKHAKHLLESTRKKSYEIAQEVGFSNAYYFSRIFKEITGTTCKEYRNLYYYESRSTDE